MEPHQLDELLLKTVEDLRLSRSERRALASVLGDLVLDRPRLDTLRSRAFDIARQHVPRREGVVLDWLEGIVKVLAAQLQSDGGKSAVYFSPGKHCVEAIGEFLGSARQSLSICVFTITDDRISERILGAHRDGVRVRILTDDEKADDLGSDIRDLARAGVPVAVDRSEKHMHHKFAIADDRRILTGSYNWTRSAAELNEENLVVSEEPSLVAALVREFEALWERLSS